MDNFLYDTEASPVPSPGSDILNPVAYGMNTTTKPQRRGVSFNPHHQTFAILTRAAMEAGEEEIRNTSPTVATVKENISGVDVREARVGTVTSLTLTGANSNVHLLRSDNDLYTFMKTAYASDEYKAKRETMTKDAFLQMLATKYLIELVNFVRSLALNLKAGTETKENALRLAEKVSLTMNNTISIYQLPKTPKIKEIVDFFLRSYNYIYKYGMAPSSTVIAKPLPTENATAVGGRRRSNHSQKHRSRHAKRRRTHKKRTHK